MTVIHCPTLGRRRFLQAGISGAVTAGLGSFATSRPTIAAPPARDLTITKIDRVTVKVPYREIPRRNMDRELPHWRYSEIFSVHLNSGHVGHGETLLYYTWDASEDDDVKRAQGKNAAAMMWDDSLGAGLQMALFDAVSKVCDVPIHRLLGEQVHDRTSLSWWNIDTSAEDMAAECKEAYKQGYMAYKTKGRPWFDIWKQMELSTKEVPNDFKIDMDFNDTLLDAKRGIPILKDVARYPQVAIFETPIPQEDVRGNQEICKATKVAVAMHYGIPDAIVAIRERICDGFVIGGGASRVMRRAHVAAMADMPFWLQLVGTGITAAWSLHFGAVTSHSTWPAVNCHQLYEHQLLKEPIKLKNGFVRIPDKPGLGYEIDWKAVDRYRVDKPPRRPEPPRLIETSWPDGRKLYIGNTGRVNFMLDIARRGEMPFFERGVNTRLVDVDDADMQAIYKRARKKPVMLESASVEEADLKQNRMNKRSNKETIVTNHQTGRSLTSRLAVAAALFLFAASSIAAESQFQLELRQREETAKKSGRFHTVTQPAQWNAKETAVIVCDMWDLHHCLNATKRGGEMAPRMNEVLNEARRRGATIIHAPSSCMAAYEDHPARKRAIAAPRAKEFPKDIGAWCHKIPSEEQGEYPIDQSDGGEDDDPQEHQKWAEKLKAMGRNPRAPWKSQTDLIDIHETDYISDNGEEIWSVMEGQGIKNVILLGVHTNMCVLGRPFGLRNMARAGKNVVLMRDMTDTMYNPASAPFVSHFTGTDLIVEHIEKWVCPTITSDQVIGGESFVFKNDTRPHLVIIMAEQEYETNQSLPEFASKHLGIDFRVSLVHANESERNDLPGIDVLADADVALISVRRRVLPAAQMKVVREFIEAGKPVVGVRTASHAFSLRGKPAPDGLVAWEKFDQEVFGGNYSNHYGNGPKTTITIAENEAKHPILTGVDVSKLIGNGSLYVVSPLAKSATPLLIGSIPDKSGEPVAWTNTTKFGGRAFYTSLAHIDDFKQADFNRLLRNAIVWATASQKKTPTAE